MAKPFQIHFILSDAEFSKEADINPLTFPPFAVDLSTLQLDFKIFYLFVQDFFHSLIIFPEAEECELEQERVSDQNRFLRGLR